jgi:hypothetical protein
MTPQESSMIEDLVRKVEGTQLTEKDPEAEQLLLEGLGRDPDAIYKLAQTVLVQNLALNQARAQLQQLQQQQAQPQPARATSFLGGLLGHRDPASAPPPPQPQYQQVPAYQPQYQAAPQYAAAPAYGAPPPAPSPVGGFLRSAATTAAGVAAGALAFEGIESLMHGGFGHGGGEGFGGGYGGGLGAPPVEETVINNYYDDPQQQGGFDEHREHEAAYDDRPEGHGGLENASYQPDTDPTSFDDSTQGDDFGSGDDFSGDFGGGDDNLV